MHKHSRRFSPSIFLCLGILLISTSTLQAQSGQEVVVLKKIGIFDPVDRTQQQRAKIIGKQMRREVASTFRFEIIPQQNLSKELPLSESDLMGLGKKFGLDGIITGTVEIKDNQLKIDLTLVEAERGVPFAREYIFVKNWSNPAAVEKGVRSIIKKLIGRIPYHAVVADVENKGEKITINAGRLQGLGDGMKLQLFRIEKVNRHPFTQETIGIEKVNVGELVVVRADERVSITKPFRLVKGEAVARGQYVVFKPSPKVLSEMASRRDELLTRQEGEWMALEETALKEKQAQAKRFQEQQTQVQKLPRVRFELDAGLSRSNYSLSSDQLELDRKISNFPLVNFSGEYWVVPAFGLNADYQAGFFKLNRVGGSSINVRVRPYWYAFHFQYRYILWRGTTDLELIGRLGYAWYTYRLSKTDLQYLTNTRYRGPSIGFEGRLPLTSRMSTGIGVDYLPVLRVEEHPVSSGQDSTSHSIQFHFDGRYRLRSGLWLSVRYLLRDYIVSFSGTGSRAGGLTGAESGDELSTIMFGLIAEF